MKTFVKGAPKAEKTAEQVAQEQAPKAVARTSTSTAKFSQKAAAPDIEFDEINEDSDYQETLALAIYGPAGAGKTRLACQAPGIVGIVPLNRKTRQTAQTVSKELGKRMVIPSVDLYKSTNPALASMLQPDCGASAEVNPDLEQPWCCAIHNSRWSVERTKRVAFSLLDRCDSILIDGFDIFCTDVLSAHFGRTQRIMPRDREPYNKEIQEFLGALQGKHLILTMSQKEVWKNDKPTGEFDWSGWPHLSYHVNCIVRMEINEKYNPQRDDDWRFALNMVLCQSNPTIIGKSGEKLLTDSAITFVGLALQVYPGSDAEKWE